MPPVEESDTSPFASKEPQDDHNPLWRFVIVIENNDVVGGNKLWKYNFCQKEVKSSYSRVKLHLLKICGKRVGICSKVSDILLEDLIRICKEAENRLKPKYVPLSSAQIPSVPQKIKKE
ncbi:hypothetical protein QL285_082470 [Trifolium repens]|nr:hypothetical protein QL285_082470 [Trifolium repens]